MRTKCAISDAFVQDCVFACCASVAQYVYSLSAEHCFRPRNNAISDERVRDCALRTHSVFRPLDYSPRRPTWSSRWSDSFSTGGRVPGGKLWCRWVWLSGWRCRWPAVHPPSTVSTPWLFTTATRWTTGIISRSAESLTAAIQMTRLASCGDWMMPPSPRWRRLPRSADRAIKPRLRTYIHTYILAAVSTEGIGGRGGGRPHAKAGATVLSAAGGRGSGQWGHEEYAGGRQNQTHSCSWWLFIDAI